MNFSGAGGRVNACARVAQLENREASDRVATDDPLKLLHDEP